MILFVLLPLLKISIMNTLKSYFILCGFLCLFISCNQNEDVEMDEFVTPSTICTKNVEPNDNDWHLKIDITEALDTSLVSIMNLMAKKQIVALTVYGEEVDMNRRVSDGQMGLVIGDDGLTCGFNLYITGSSEDRVCLVSRACESYLSCYFDLSILFGIGSGLTYGSLYFDRDAGKYSIRSIPPYFSDKKNCLYVEIASNYIPAGYGYYKRFYPRRVDLMNLDWGIILHSQYKSLDLHPCTIY